MNSWHWLWEFEEVALRRGDHSRIRLCQIFREAHALSHDLPDEKLAYFEKGRDLANQLHEPWWSLFYEHWAIETLLYGKQEPKLALDRVVRAVVEAHKPAYDGYPQRIDLHLNLVGAYLGIDPIGYEDKLREALDFVEGECRDNVDKSAYFLQLKGYFLEAVGDPEAIDIAWQYLAKAEEAQSEHFQWDALYLLSSTLYRFDRDEARLQLREIAELGENVARNQQRNRGVAAFQMWRAVAAVWEGELEAGQELYLRACELQTRVPPPRNDVQFGAMAYYEALGELDQSLKVCQQLLRVLRAHKLTFLEAQRRLEKCRLLAKMGRSWDREARRLEKVAAGLLSRAHWEGQIAELRGQTS